MPNPPDITLKNQILTATICGQTGKLRHLAHRPDAPTFIQDTQWRYFSKNTGDWQWLRTPTSVQPIEHGAQVQLRDTSFSITTTYTLPPGAALLKIQTQLHVLAPEVCAKSLSFPYLELSPDFNNTYEDPNDLYFDGLELPDGSQLPPWRVLFRHDHQSGLLIACRNRNAMAHLDLTANAVASRMVFPTLYSIMMGDLSPLWHPVQGDVVTHEFELAPWSQPSHGQLLHEAALDRPTPAFSTPSPLQLTATSPLTPSTLPLQAACDPKRPILERWLQITPSPSDLPLLIAGPGVTPEPITIPHNLTGPHRLIVGIAHGAGLMARSNPTDPWRIRLSPAFMSAQQHRKPFTPYLSGTFTSHEIDFGEFDLTHYPIQLARHPDLHLTTAVQYARLEPITHPATLSTPTAQHPSFPSKETFGFVDTPDFAWVLDTRSPAPSLIDAVISAHADAGISDLFWRVDGQCSDFPSSTNTMRYPSAKVHGVFYPQSKTYGRLLQKCDLLQTATDAAKRFNVNLWGWMRFNSYSGNVASDFFKQNPQYHEQTEPGNPAAKLCLAWPEVRRHKIQILVEAAKYGLKGLCLGFLRMAPVLLYAPRMCQEYQALTGHQPPRDPNHPDPLHVRSFPERSDPEFLAWWRFRAGYLTQFGRELRQALAAENLAHVRIAIWVRPHHTLFDGIDLDAWLDEKLCDTIVASPYDYTPSDTQTPWYWEPENWVQRIGSRAQVIRDIGPEAHRAPHDIAQARARGYDGLCFYESNQSAMDPDFIRLLKSLKQ